MKKFFSITILSFLLCVAGCKKDSEFLDVPPLQVIPQDVAFSDPALVLSILGDLYNRQLDFTSLDGRIIPESRQNEPDNPEIEGGWRTMADFSESFPSENGSYFLVQRTGWGYGEWRVDWSRSYRYIREVNLFIERTTAATQLSSDDKTRFLAEGRFLRANYYFEMVKRMGGVPLITSSLVFDATKDPSETQVARAKESDIYDFIISEADAVKDQLPADVNIKSRATKAAVLAMKTRAALYAASIAKYGVTTPQVSLPGGEVGIAPDKAAGYYTTALQAAQEIISGGAGSYQLYQVLPNLSDNFAAIFIDKSSVNQESIFVEDFRAGGAGRSHSFTTNNQPYSFSDEGGDAGRLNPSLNLVQAFEKLDNTYAPLPTVDGSGNPIYYDNQQDIFTGRDARLAGTVLLPDALFKGTKVDIWAGYLLGDGSILTSDEAGQLKPLPGTTTPVQVVGKDGPVNIEFRAQSGFYIRKYLDPTVGSGRRGRGSDVAFIRYRYAEVLLNAAEAAFELGQTALAADYMNQVRSRAGLTTALTPAEITFDRIVHERRVELAFEGHILFDAKRWRIAHIIWDGTPMTLADLKSNIGKATKRNTQPWALLPYRVYNPGSANNEKWVFKEAKPAVVTGSNRFQFGNYYSEIRSEIIAVNPKIVRQPNQ